MQSVNTFLVLNDALVFLLEFLYKTVKLDLVAFLGHFSQSSGLKRSCLVVTKDVHNGKKFLRKMVLCVVCKQYQGV